MLGLLVPLLNSIVKGLKSFFNFLFPSLCLRCKKTLSPDEALFCNCCVKTLPLAKAYCKRCGTILKETLLNYFTPEKLTYCGHCENNTPFYDKTFLGFKYENPIKELLIEAKFRENYMIAYQLGRLLRKVISLPLKVYDLYLPIPLSKERERARGYNQSLLLLWGFLGFQLPCGTLKRIRHTTPQSQLSPEDRLENVRGVFAVSEKLNDSRVLLIDDVLTTGATANEASKTLKKAGAKEVHLLVLSRA
ncbi:MAG: ComF family protein [Caldimicrobium sp.]|nr:ComF family protein [Caldimicrobium sp.]